MEEMLRKARILVVQSVIFFSFGFLSSNAIGVTADNPIYCHQNECLYCDDNGCIVTSTDSNAQADSEHTVDNDLSSYNVNELLSDLMQEPSSPQVNQTPSSAHASPSLKKRQNVFRKASKAKPASQPAAQKRIQVNKQVEKPVIFHYQPTIDIAQYALHQGNIRSANLVEAFIPIGKWAFDNLLFLDLRYYNPNNTPIEGNVDLGFRHLFGQGNKLFGFYAGYDRYRSETRHYYNQINMGGELWVRRLFMGGNVYIPFGTKVYDDDDLNLAYLVPTNTSYRYNISYEQGKERAMPGADAEVGYDFTHSLTIYGGGYYFDHSSAKSIAGPKLRATYTFYRSNTHRLLRLFDRIRLEGLISHDSVRGTSWLLGLRFTFGFGHYSNPTQGVIRHMADPIRRDLNVVAEGFNLQPEPYRIEGRLARVDIVNGTKRKINDAVDGNADIIGVNGSQTATDELVIGSRELTITGGAYEFAVDGHPYVVHSLASNGNITAVAGSGLSVFTLYPNASPVTLEHLALNHNSVNDDQFALFTSGESFGHLLIKDVSSNLPFDIRLDASANDSTGQVSFINNTITLTDSNAENTHTGGITGLALLVTGTDDQQLTISALRNNQITITNSNSNQDLNLYGIFISSASDNLVALTTGVKKNTIDIENNFTGVATTTKVRGFDTSNIISYGDFSENQFTVQGYAGTTFREMSAMYAINTFNLIKSNFSYNKFFSSNQTVPGGDGFACVLAESGSVTIGGNFSNNRFVGTENDGAGEGLLTDGDIEVTGNVSNNHFESSFNGTIFSNGWRSEGAVTIDGDLSNNEFISSDNGVDGVAWKTVGDLTIMGDYSYNTFTVTRNNTSGTGGNNLTIGNWLSSGDKEHTIYGDMIGNIFNITDNPNMTAHGLDSHGMFHVMGQFSNNEFNIANNGHGDGMRIRRLFDVDGNFSENKFTLSNNTVENNAFYLTENDASDDIVVNFNGFVSNNEITITDTGGVTSSGFRLTLTKAGEELNFDKTVQNNSINFSSTSGSPNFYGFRLSASDSSNGINFNDNSEVNLKSLNGNTTVEIAASPNDNVNFSS